MIEDIKRFEQRKQDHIQLALMDENQAIDLQSLDHIKLNHEALPDLDFCEINISTYRFNQKVATPFVVSSMTAGHEHAAKINRHLLAACQQQQWAMGVGSQRRELNDPLAFQEWQALIKDYPDVDMYSNIGIAQLILTPIDGIKRLIDNIQAKALIVHLNPLQECIQPEGTPQFKGGFKALERCKRELALPIIVKETGCGFSEKTLKKLNEINIDVVDLSGGGGTHWGRIEGHRTGSDDVRQSAAHTFRNWGIDTLNSLINAQRIKPQFEIWASGGVRHGLDAARLLALGASSIAFAKPLLSAALINQQAVIDVMKTITFELKTAMFCTGSSHIDALRDAVCITPQI